MNKLLEQYGAMMQNSNSSSGGGSKKSSSFKAVILTTIVLSSLFSTYHYKTTSKLSKKYKKVKYESVKTHPYNHCVDIITSNLVKSGSKVDLSQVQETCKQLQDNE